MRIQTRLLAVFMAFLMLVPGLVACGGENTDADTEVGEETCTEARTEGTETASSEQTAESGMQEIVDTEAETSAEAVAEPILSLDFDTELSLSEYFAAIEGTEMNAGLRGGEIKDGKWHYNEKPLAFKDDCGIYDLAAYSLEFEFCFHSFVNKENTSVFTFITDGDGVLGAESSFYALKMDTDGKLYHFSLKAGAVQIERGRVYRIKYEINTKDRKATIYLDGALFASVDYGQPKDAYNCFRFMDVGRGGGYVDR